ncbi:hypothetical protein [Phycicoccus sonneratiae]|uniref:Uncharacterized protein n=1 Tax=Phycicoccus sonneratiae TaxID=2807628 RepID=A0ABS2CKM7_9MICO|nr:hypothetical protein [Phycicoccus sonneraticus]MBM6400447.1 hypothetical protein [Phycicoccus sonneraticus]
MTAREALRRRFRPRAGSTGAYAMEMPVHLLRALYVRDHWGLEVTDPPPALGLARDEALGGAELAPVWSAWWTWLVGLDAADPRLLDRPGRPAPGSRCPPVFAALLDDDSARVGAWTTSWRTRFRDEILPRGTGVEQRLAGEPSGGDPGRPLSVAVLPVDGPWLSWVGPSRLLVSQHCREDPERYLARAAASRPDAA